MSTEWSNPSGPAGPPPGGGSGPSGPRASFGLRLVAAIIDGLILDVIAFVLYIVLKSAGSGLSLILGLAYFTYFEGSPSGQTPGKRVMGIRVIDFRTGGALGYGKALLRWVGRIVSTIACLLGYLWMLWDKERQTWHDKIAETVVVPTSAYPVENWPG
jgi:uncharacterized RDD family membrane protein YckC